jgi:hypothetical protein
MPTVISFPVRRSAKDRLHEVLEAYQTAVTSRLRANLTQTGFAENSLDAQQLAAKFQAGFEPFSLYLGLRQVYVDRLGLSRMETILAGIRATDSYSKHICDKAADFLRSGRPYFKREAQFPPEVIRRPEKNLYFATTFNMVFSKLFLACHREMFGNDPGAVYVIEQCQNLDRCSMRLVQNMLLQLKPFCVQMELVFKRRAEGSQYEASSYERRFVAARKRCFGKLLNVAIVTGCADESLDIDGFLRGVDFQSSFLAMTNAETGAGRTDLDSFRDMLYRNAYERF